MKLRNVVVMKKNGFIEGTFIATFAIFFSKFLGMIYVIPFYSIIGEQGGALYAYAYNVYILFLGISTAGIPIAMSKLISEYDTLEMKEAKERSYKIARNIILVFSLIAFFALFMFAEEFGKLILGDITGGNTISDVAFVIRTVSFCLLIIPFLSVTRGYLQGHKFISASSFSQVIEQIARIIIILAGSYFVIKIIHGEVKTAVGVSVFAAFISGVIAYIYLKVIMSKNKKQMVLPKKGERDNVLSKDIVKKIIKYSLPIIIVNVAINVYNLTDMVLINRGLDILGYPGPKIETITSIVSTWASKICMIISAFGTGLCVSLLPFITSSYVKKDMEKVNLNLNRSIQIVIVTSFPTAIGLAFLADPVYTLFFGKSLYGPLILILSVFIAAIANLHFVTTSTLQGLSKFKCVYISTFAGFVINALLDIPIILLFDKIGLPPYLGASTSSIIGNSIAFIIPCIYLKKELNINYNKTLEVMKKMIVPTLAMSILLLIYNLIFPIHTSSFITNLLITIFYTITGGLLFLILLFKNGGLQDIFGNELIDKILIKLRLKKVK